MSHWQNLSIENKIVDILSSVPPYEEGHHMGHPFLTAYQLAIEYNRRHSEDVVILSLTVGGAGTGSYNSLAQYLARQLSQRVLDGNSPFEGGFLSNQHLKEMVFDDDGRDITSSLMGTPLTTSVFRLSQMR